MYEWLRNTNLFGAQVPILVNKVIDSEIQWAKDTYEVLFMTIVDRKTPENRGV